MQILNHAFSFTHFADEKNGSLERLNNLPRITNAVRGTAEVRLASAAVVIYMPLAHGDV